MCKVGVHVVDDDFAIITVTDSFCLRTEICRECPFRTDIKTYPAEIFRRAAPTSYDGAVATLGCHVSAAAGRAEVCAGFVLSQGRGNRTVRHEMSKGADLRALLAVVDVERHGTYRAMAVANGVNPYDPALRECRDDGQLTLTFDQTTIVGLKEE